MSIPKEFSPDKTKFVENCNVYHPISHTSVHVRLEEVGVGWKAGSVHTVFCAEKSQVVSVKDRIPSSSGYVDCLKDCPHIIGGI